MGFGGGHGHNPWALDEEAAGPIVGATRPGHLDDAAAALGLDLTDAEALEAAYTPRLPTGF
ncbi:hypothetical protein ACFRAR_30445 [Kitasatospora sp. NPDC056651]|uniref:hypothetical protein n=1 Tax=Kitasatospora sp. NPDC056651 TaxID=3345892 RepID=UPI0036C45DB7